MVHLRFSRRLKISDSVRDKIEGADMREFDGGTVDTIKEWLDENVTPLLQLLWNCPVDVEVKNGVLYVTDRTPEEVKDAVDIIASECPAFRNFVECNTDHDYDNLECDCTEEQLADLIKTLVSDPYQKFNMESGTGEVVIFLPEPEEVCDSLRLKVVCDDATDEINGKTLDVDGVLENVILPAIQKYVSQQDFDVDVSVYVNDGEIVVDTRFDKDKVSEENIIEKEEVVEDAEEPSEEEVVEETTETTEDPAEEESTEEESIEEEPVEESTDDISEEDSVEVEESAEEELIEPTEEQKKKFKSMLNRMITKLLKDFLLEAISDSKIKKVPTLIIK